MNFSNFLFEDFFLLLITTVIVYIIFRWYTHYTKKAYYNVDDDVEECFYPDTWKISLENKNSCIIDSLRWFCKNENSKRNSYLLNTRKKKFNILEKIVYEIAEFHFNRLNMIFDNSKNIEFWIKNSANCNSFHFDCDEYDNKINKPEILSTPLLSCIVYLNDNDIPTVITNVNQKNFNRQYYSKNNTIAVSFPKTFKHITFDGGNNLHGTTKFFEKGDETRYILAINLWDKRPKDVHYFDHLTFTSTVSSDDNTKIEKISKYKKLINIHLNEKNTKTIKLKNREIINPYFFETFIKSKKFYPFLKPYQKKKCQEKYDGFLKIGKIIKEDLKDFDTFLFELPKLSK